MAQSSLSGNVRKDAFILWKYWVLIGAGSGAFFSGLEKFSEIWIEPPVKYDNKLFEIPIRGVYHISRVAGYAGWGAAIGGAAALTAPISIPLYIYWKGDEGEEK